MIQHDGYPQIEKQTYNNVIIAINNTLNYVLKFAYMQAPCRKDCSKRQRHINTFIINNAYSIDGTGVMSKLLNNMHQLYLQCI